MSPEPDILSIKLDPNRHKCLVIASDGLWNVIKPQQSVDFVDELERRVSIKTTVTLGRYCESIIIEIIMVVLSLGAGSTRKILSRQEYCSLELLI